MATQAQVAASLKLQLSNDAPDRLAQAGENWMQLPMGFYYGNTPHSEISVDIAVRASMLRVLVQDEAILPQPVWNGLVAMINTNTVVQNAIGIMFLATSHEIPVEMPV